MSEHTPGEWIDRGTGCVGTRLQLVASVYPMEYENPEEHAANMRLIAASPDLLEACIAAAECDALLDDFTLAALRQAIAKATGGEP